MKKRKILSIVALLILVSTQFAFSAPNVATVTIHLEENQAIKPCAAVRSGNYSTVWTRCLAVYPDNGGNDNYTRIGVQVFTEYIPCEGMEPISNAVTLNENNTTNSTLTIWEGKLSIKDITMGYYGNNPDLSADAKVYYNAR